MSEMPPEEHLVHDFRPLLATRKCHHVLLPPDISASPWSQTKGSIGQKQRFFLQSHFYVAFCGSDGKNNKIK